MPTDEPGQSSFACFHQETSIVNAERDLKCAKAHRAEMLLDEDTRITTARLSALEGCEADTFKARKDLQESRMFMVRHQSKMGIPHYFRRLREVAQFGIGLVMDCIAPKQEAEAWILPLALAAGLTS